MLEKGKITPYQLFSMMTGFIFGSTVILQNVTAAGRDSWLSTVLAILGGLGMVLITTQLSVTFPNLTLIEYTEVLFGKILGKCIGAVYLWYFLHLGALVLRNYGDLMTITVMQETPLWFFHITLALVVAFMVYNRIEVMGRVSEILLPFGVGFSFFISTLVTLSGIVEIKNLQPVLEHRITDILKSTFAVASFPYLEVILFTMIFPYVNIPAKTRKYTVWAIIVGGFSMLVILVENIGIFGETMPTITFPRYTAIRMISVGNFIERIDPIVLAIWIMGGLAKIGVCLYAFVLGLAQLLGLKYYTHLILPSTIMMIVLSILLYTNTMEMLDFAANVYPLYAFPLQVFLPLLMLILAAIRKPGT